MSRKKLRPDQALRVHVRSQGAAPSALATPDAQSRAAAADEPAHWPLDDLRWSGDEGWMPKSLALLCRAPATKAVVFVHGFGGGADGTWEQFPRSLRAIPEARLADAFLVDYPSTTQTIAFCAGKFRNFLRDLLREPVENILNLSLPRDAPRRPADSRYEKVILVGHSMGAVVARRALLDLDEELTSGERKALRMLFFAPAHKGARNLGKLVESGFGLDRLPFGGLVGALLRLRYRPIADLTKESDCLHDLSSSSKAAREARDRAKESVDYLRARVYHAEKENIVYNDRFDHDFPTNPVMAQNHRSICKPREEYDKPVEALRRLL